MHNMLMKLGKTEAKRNNILMPILTRVTTYIQSLSHYLSYIASDFSLQNVSIKSANLVWLKIGPQGICSSHDFSVRSYFISPSAFFLY